MKQIFFALLATLLVFSPHASAAPVKVATVDMSRVLNESGVAKSKRQKIEEMSAEKRKEIESQRNTLAELEKKLRSAQVKEDSKEADEFRAKVKDLSRLIQDSEEELRREYARVQKDLTDDALEVVKSYAESNDIGLVIEKSKIVRGAVLFGEPSLDVTDAILERLKKSS